MIDISYKAMLNTDRGGGSQSPDSDFQRKNSEDFYYQVPPAYRVESVHPTGQVREQEQVSRQDPQYDPNAYRYQTTFQQPYYQPYQQAPIEPKKRKMSTGLKVGISLLLVLFLAVGGVIGALIGHGIRSGEPGTTPTPVPTTSPEPTKPPIVSPGGPNRPEGALTPREVATLAVPSVVAINTTQSTVNFFGQAMETMGAGSGVLIRKDGYIATNNHVVAGSSKIKVRLFDGREFAAKLIGRDPDHDLAVIKIDSDTDLPFVEMADSDTVQVGDMAIAIGNPLGELEGTLTVGYISALHRTITVTDASGRDPLTLFDMIQTDAAINAGNSGGALMNDRGQLIGINSAKNAGEGVEGIGFAIPTNVVEPIVTMLVEQGYISGRPSLGVYGQTVPSDIVERYAMPQGFVISEVVPGGAAEKAGMQRGDIIIEFDGVKIKQTSDLMAARAKRKAGDEVKVVVWRTGQEVSMTLILDEQKVDQ